jgi:hypothetical protein
MEWSQGYCCDDYDNCDQLPKSATCKNCERLRSEIEDLTWQAKEIEKFGLVEESKLKEPLTFAQKVWLGHVVVAVTSGTISLMSPFFFQWIATMWESGWLGLASGAKFHLSSMIGCAIVMAPSALVLCWALINVFADFEDAWKPNVRSS